MSFKTICKDIKDFLLVLLSFTTLVLIIILFGYIQLITRCHKYSSNNLNIYNLDINDFKYILGFGISIFIIITSILISICLIFETLKNIYKSQRFILYIMISILIYGLGIYLFIFTKNCVNVINVTLLLLIINVIIYLQIFICEYLVNNTIQDDDDDGSVSAVSSV